MVPTQPVVALTAPVGLWRVARTVQNAPRVEEQHCHRPSPLVIRCESAVTAGGCGNAGKQQPRGSPKAPATASQRERQLIIARFIRESSAPCRDDDLDGPRGGPHAVGHDDVSKTSVT